MSDTGALMSRDGTGGGWSVPRRQSLRMVRNGLDSKISEKAS